MIGRSTPVSLCFHSFGFYLSMLDVDDPSNKRFLPSPRVTLCFLLCFSTLQIFSLFMRSLLLSLYSFLSSFFLVFGQNFFTAIIYRVYFARVNSLLFPSVYSVIEEPVNLISCLIVT